jgi:hypothetical protein
VSTRRVRNRPSPERLIVGKFSPRADHPVRRVERLRCKESSPRSLGDGSSRRANTLK